MNRLIFLFLSLSILNISAFDIPNIFSSYINPKICNLSDKISINCFYEINIWYYVPSDISKIYFTIPSEEEYTDINFYFGNLEDNQLSNIELIEKNSGKIYEIEREHEKLYVNFIEEQNKYKKIKIKHFYSDNENTYIEPKILQLSYYKNYPIELVSNPLPQSCLSFYDYEKDPNRIYLISNNNYFIYNIDTNSSSINYNIYNLQYFDQYDMNNKNEYQIYKSGEYYYLISKMIFIKIEKNGNLLNLEDISSTNQKFIDSKIKNDANVYNLEQIEYKNGIFMHLYFKYNERKVCSIEYGCDEPSIGGTMTYISFYYDGECFIVKNRNEIYKCSFKNNGTNMKLSINNKINNQFIDDNEYEILQIRVFQLDENNSNFLLCTLTTTYSLFCTVFNYNSIENDLSTKKTIEIFSVINDIKLVNIFPYKSNSITNANLIIIVYKGQYSIIDVNNNISITGQQTFKSNSNINKDTAFYDLGNNKYILAYTSSQLNVGLDMGTIPKSKKVLKIVENYQEYLEISFKELYNENEKLSNENYKVIFIKAIFDTEDSSFNSNDIKFYYNNYVTNLKYNDESNSEYEIRQNNDDSQKLIVKLSNSIFNIFLNYTIIGEQFASKNLIKIMNLPKCNKFCDKCDYEYAHLSTENNHYCETCGNNYKFFYKIENDGKYYNNCYSSCPSQNLYYIPDENECYKKCPNKTPFYILINFQCFTECPSGYYQYENSFECNDICPNDYFKDEINKKCVSICPKGYYGEKSSKKCVENCPSNFYKNDLNNLCVKICPGQLLSDTQNKICVDKCPEELFLYEANRFCVENCPLNYYKDKISYKCVKQCPEEYYGDNNYKICLKNCGEGYKRDYLTDQCIEDDKSDEEIIKNSTNQIDLKINNNNECIKNVTENYIDLIDSESIYICNNLKILIYQSNKISAENSKEISKMNNITYIDINKCLEYIIDKDENLHSKDDFIIIIIESQSNSSLLENFNFYVYDLNNNQINMKVCEENNIPIVISKNINLKEVGIDIIDHYKESYSFDITDKNSEFFNNICTSLKTKDGLDLTMEYRRSKIYINNICGNDIEYTINYEESTINCIISDFNDYNEKRGNKQIENNTFRTSLSNTNIIMIKCYKFIFNISKAIKNIANWLILSLFIIKCLFVLIYICTSTNSIETFLVYWQIFKDTGEINDIINNNFIPTIPTENNEIRTHKKFFKNLNNKKDNKIINKNKKNILETLTTLVQSIKVQKKSEDENDNNASPPKKRKDISYRNSNNAIRTKKEEKEFVFQKTDKINYTKYVDKDDDDVISDGCYPVIKIDYEVIKKQEEERKKKEEEERKRLEEERKRIEEEKRKKEEEERKKIEEEERVKKEEEERKKKKEEEKRKKREEREKLEEEKKRKLEEEIKKKEEEKKKLEEEENKIEENNKSENEEKKEEEEEKKEEDGNKKEEYIKKKEEEKRKKEEEKKKKEEKKRKKEEEKKKRKKEKYRYDEVDMKKKLEEEKQKRFQEMKKKKEEDDKKWKKELERREMVEAELKRKNKEIIKNKMKEIYERRNYGFDEENNIDFLKKMEKLEKLREKNKKNNTKIETGFKDNIEHNNSKEISSIEIKNLDISEVLINNINEEDKKDIFITIDKENNIERLKGEVFSKESENKKENNSEKEKEIGGIIDEEQFHNNNTIKESLHGKGKEEENNKEKENKEKENEYEINNEENEKEKNNEENENEFNNEENENESSNEEKENDENTKEEIENNDEKKEKENDENNNEEKENGNENKIHNEENEINNRENENEINNKENEKEINNEENGKEINKENNSGDINYDKKENKPINTFIDDNKEEKFPNIINKHSIILEDYFEEDEKVSNNDYQETQKEINEDEKKSEEEDEKDNDVKIEIKDYSDLDNEFINNRCVNDNDNGRIKSSKRRFLEEKQAINYQKEKEKKINSIFMKDVNNKYYLSYKEYNSSIYRINNLSYENAIKLDKRNYFSIYKYYIINSEIVLNLILVPNYLELFCLKIIFLMYIIGSEGLFNALLYEDKYINNIYDNNGKYIFIYNFPKSIFSTIITYIIDIFLFHLITSKYKLQEILENQNIKNYQSEFESIIKCLKKKIFVFFIIDFIITGFAWYYCSIFCALYQNTSKYWLISLVISLGIHLILPFILCFIPTTLRYCALKKKKQKLYNLNKMLELII